MESPANPLLTVTDLAALAATKKLVAWEERGNMVMILPDRRDRYFSQHLYE